MVGFKNAQTIETWANLGDLVMWHLNSGFQKVIKETECQVRAYDESMEMFTAAQSDPNMGDLHLDRRIWI